MGMTISEKILAAHAEQDLVRPGEFVEVKVDLALANDITAPLAIQVFHKLGASHVFDPERIVLVQDHFVPNKDIPSAQQVKTMAEFARRYRIRNFFELGETGIEHVIVPEKGLVTSGDLVIGADSHTCTYGALGAFSTGVGSTDLGVVMATGKIWLKVPRSIKVLFSGKLPKWVQGKDLILATLGRLGVAGAVYKSIEFAGEVIKGLSMAQRFTMANMAVECGAKNGIFAPDEVVREYVTGRGQREPRFFQSDDDAVYDEVVEIEVSHMEPQVAMPHSPDNVTALSQLNGVRVDQVFIGSCTNGRLEDLRVAARVLKGRRVAKGTRLIIIPGSSDIYLNAVGEGLIQDFLEAGAVIGPPCCGPCLGGHMGVLAKGETAISTSNRNFKGRMGHPESQVYLSNPAVAAASAVMGRIGSPEEL
ncbi:MAG: 3-isopropylmalate dehydratase large subunit [Deltaproteobacteria bacterium]|nr:3-isopropylmalate dehydratase large subunit [Deltaproteobacteria bacterium]MBW1928185.1 3-isopropylmalate dehydratase large subunit [Deltaproteobacteria bacterium]MBW2025428.1 3-isopropylmalate dehydratase large subunit [Deltaproteobacteria bacterium]MBW2126409.1 3-isopropylmalate dehydratase large subunit [Deltaproteobacteria bacterium]RLB16167.1 MAG: 3-isopropylmalate dehydratase large subunit [Deltaproteobacteria bacterium]